jgi:transcriptional regulator GlxA family with amidase domain
MKRRNFLYASLAFGLGLPRLGLARQESRNSGANAIAEGGPLTPPADKPIQVAVAVSSGTTWIDFVGPEAVFQTWHFDPVEKKHKPRFNVFLVSEKVEPVSHLVPDYSFENAPPAQIVLVPAQSGSTALQEWLRKSVTTADVTMSVCTGARHLAKAGLLDRKRATSHHEAIDEFMKNYPAVKWLKGMRFVEGQRISTGGGLTAGIDLALRVTERYFGRAWAQEVADHLEYQGKGWIV